MIRKAEFTDASQLRALWKTVFGDGDEFLDLYFRNYFVPENVLTALQDGKIVSMSTIYRHDSLYAGGRVPGCCPCIFAVATYREYRGKGLAMELIRRQLLQLKEEGERYVMIAPAGKTLFSLYESRFGFRTYFKTLRLLCSPAPDAGKPPVQLRGSLQRIPAAVYNMRREYFLEETNHLKYTDRQISMEAQICELSGGGLFALRCGADAGICAAEWVSDTCLRVNELIIAEEAMCAAVNTIHAVFGAQEYEVRVCPYMDRLAIDESMRSYPGVSFHKAPEPAAMLLDLQDPTGNLPTESAYAGFLFD